MANHHEQTYKTFTLAHQCQPILLATELTSLAFCKDYLVYEHHDEWAIGINKLTQLTVSSSGEITDFNGYKHRVKPTKICQTIHQATQTLNIKDWRLFGRADFEFCRFAHNLQQQETSRELLELFVPETDIRITKKRIVIRTMDDTVLPQIQSIIADCTNNMTATEHCHTALTQDDILHAQAVKQHFQESVRSAVEEIKEHKYNKVILSRVAILPANVDSKKSFIEGRRKNTPARSFMLKLGEIEAFGFSPETVLEVDEHGNLSTQPLAGTRALPDDPQAAILLRNELLTDPKEIAEHAASVKLAVEELTQICPSSTVNVAEFMQVSERGSVQHLASRVTGNLSEGKSAWDAFNVLFPSITASGIPKREAIDAIARFELLPRGLYSGSVLVTDHNGYFDAALVLRTAYKHQSVSLLQAGAGIIGLSTPEREWEETGEKMACVLDHLVFEKGQEKHHLATDTVPADSILCEEKS
ncbi:salicylate synthase [Shewanella psychropiezotolerans]|uniref:Salicylate synthase n=1 Tax=Shewanella psychropiezotolerans TaxID=2593655 RepID=A0ABX5X0F8_9GAMM|nr:salicylate synthase [Shewanella psychropiezotolerans]QDO84840.1 salicylate synthase [Shewanella psychropiezotolerans]